MRPIILHNILTELGFEMESASDLKDYYLYTYYENSQIKVSFNKKKQKVTFRSVAAWSYRESTKTYRLNMLTEEMIINTLTPKMKQHKKFHRVVKLKELLK